MKGSHLCYEMKVTLPKRCTNHNDNSANYRICHKCLVLQPWQQCDHVTNMKNILYIIIHAIAYVNIDTIHTYIPFTTNTHNYTYTHKCVHTYIVTYI